MVELIFALWQVVYEIGPIFRLPYLDIKSNMEFEKKNSRSRIYDSLSIPVGSKLSSLSLYDQRFPRAILTLNEVNNRLINADHHLASTGETS